ncbi:uncharacterized protein LOC110933044 [Helianthus annuus]|uniref:uncharacterized protein LOC110933044 n=1 Tax=Helianthus annuus TaxID=4232 RepID=UPI000B8F42AE|nr:uncharacterized protein LOC110933044 [Helianthus annuus]
MSCEICFNPCTIFERVDDAKKGEKNDSEENPSVTFVETSIKEKEKGGDGTLKIQADDEDTQLRIVQSQVNSASLKTTADIKRVRDESRALVEKQLVLQKEKEEDDTSLKKSPGEKNDSEENPSVTFVETSSKEKEKGGDGTLKIQADDEDTQMRIVQSQVNSAGLKTTADIKRVRDESRALVEKQLVLQKEKEEDGTSLKKSPVRKTRLSTTTASKTKPVTTLTTTSAPTKSLTPPPLTIYVTQTTATNTTSTHTLPQTPLAAILHQRRKQSRWMQIYQKKTKLEKNIS